jgi:hypothetical protein
MGQLFGLVKLSLWREQLGMCLGEAVGDAGGEG